MRVGVRLLFCLLALGLVAGCHGGPAPSPSASPAPRQAAPPATAAPAAGPSSFEVGREASEIDLRDTKVVVIENPFGNVHVIPDGTDIRAELVRYARGKTAQEAGARGNPFRMTTRGTIVNGVRQETITIAGGEKDPQVGASVTLHVPVSVAVKVKVAEGEVRVEDFPGDVTVEGGAGAVSIGQAAGKVKVSTSAGEVTVEGAQRGLEAQASTGALRLAGANGKVVARTMSGAITLGVGHSDSIEASSMSAPITLAVASPFAGRLKVSSSSGDLRVTLPVTSDVRVETTTGSGPITCTLPLKNVKRAGPNVSGTLGTGKGLVRVTNDTGGIVVSATK